MSRISRRVRLFSVLGVALLVAMTVASLAIFHPGATSAQRATDQSPYDINRAHDLPSPQSDRQRALRQVAVEMKAQGKVSGKVAHVGKGKGGYVELEREGESAVWGVLAEFGAQIHPSYGGSAGPLHNQIPQPDRATDNTTIWQADFNQQHYNDVLFGAGKNDISMRNYYIEQSSGRYAVHGNVENWVKVPYNEARYGTDACGSIVCSTVWLLIRDEINLWYNQQIAAGKTPDQINAYLASFDQEDRYDYNNNGNFNEPDGYIDHFESIHAGDGEETGGGAQGDDAIWSHRWFAFYNLFGSAGPAFNKYGGLQIGQSNYWIGDYEMQPENGGVGVFSHEFGHDLGLPDEYDTAGNTCGSACENSTAWWTLMSQGSYGTVNNTDLGTYPVSMSSWDKLQLGWLDYTVAQSSADKTYVLGPAEYNNGNAEAVIVLLPDKQVTSQVGAPYAGSKYYYSTTGNNLDTAMTRSFSLPAGASLSAKVRYNIEQDWDYAYLEVSTDGGATWNNVATNLSTNTNPNGQNKGNGITGVSTNSGWVDLTADLSAYGGQTVALGFRYWTDVAQQGQPGEASVPGISIDEINVSGSPTDGAETDTGWTYSGSGFHATTGTEVQSYFNAYIAEYRQYRGYDASLQKGPYNFGFLDNPNRQNYVEHFPYQDGLLVWYWDTSEADNNVSDHHGSGLILPVDSHPTPLMRPDNNPWRPRVQSYDSTFTLEPTDAITLHQNSVAKSYPSLPAVSLFDDNNSYWSSTTATASVQVPHTGTKIRVVSMTNQKMVIKVGPHA